MTNNVSAAVPHYLVSDDNAVSPDAGAAAACQALLVGDGDPALTPNERHEPRPAITEQEPRTAPIPPTPRCHRLYGPGGLLPDSHCKLWGWVPLLFPITLWEQEAPAHPRLRRRTPKTEVTAWREARGIQADTLQQEPARPRHALPLPKAGPSATQAARAPEPPSQAVSRVCTHGRCPPSGCRQLAHALLAPGPQG